MRRGGMKRRIVIGALALAAAPLGSPRSAAQPSVPPPSPELVEGMRTAAGAYERKDYATALELWRKFAAEGNAEAETLLGAMYWSGEGVPRDHAEAARLYLRAAHKGYARAQNDIGFIFNWFMPALVNSSVGSLAGTREEEWTSRCPF